MALIASEISTGVLSSDERFSSSSTTSLVRSERYVIPLPIDRNYFNGLFWRVNGKRRFLSVRTDNLNFFGRCIIFRKRYIKTRANVLSRHAIYLNFSINFIHSKATLCGKHYRNHVSLLLPIIVERLIDGVHRSRMQVGTIVHIRNNSSQVGCSGGEHTTT